MHDFLTIELKSSNPFTRIGITYYYLPLNLKFDRCLIDRALILGLAETVSLVNVLIAILAKSAFV